MVKRYFIISFFVLIYLLSGGFMFEEIYKIIEKNTNAVAGISPKYITEIFYILIEGWDLKRYVDFIIFVDKLPAKLGKGIYAFFYPENKYILVGKNGLEKYRNIFKKGSKARGKDLSIYLNECSITLLLHELEHVKHIKYLVESPKYDIKYEILKLANFYYYVNIYKELYGEEYLINYYGKSLEEYYGKKYKKFLKQVDELNKKDVKLYNCDPMELNADYLAYKNIYAINQNENLNKTWREIITNTIRNAYLDDEDCLIFPLGEYILKRNKILTLDKVRMKDFKYKKLSLDERVSLGLPITLKEYKNFDRYIKKHL